MRIEVWADVTCPWCGIGFHRLRAALSRFPHADHVSVVHRSYQLLPHAPEGTWPVGEHMAGRYGMSPEQVTASIDHLEATATAEGITPFRLRDNVMGSTALTHEFLAFAGSEGAGEEAWALAFDIYFGTGRPVFDVDTLVGLAADLGLDPEQARTVLDERRFRASVEADIHALRARGIQGVPYHVFAGRYALPGTDRVEVLGNILQLAWAHASGDPGPGASVRAADAT